MMTTPANDDRLAPLWSEDAEQCVLSAIIMDNTAASVVRTKLEAVHFFAGQHQHIFNAMCDVLDKGGVADPISVSHQLAEMGALEKAGGKDYIGFLIDVVPTAANVEYHAGIVRETANRRAMLKALEETATLVRTGEVQVQAAAAELQNALLPIAVSSTRKGFVHIKDDLWDVLEDIELRSKGERITNAIATGYPEIDGPIGGGLQRGELMFLAGAPGGLKSAAAMNISVNVVRDSEPKTGVAFVSAEMKRWKLHGRNLARMAQVPFTSIRHARLHDDDWPRIARVAGEMVHWPMWVDETPRPTLVDTAAKARHLKARHPEIGLLVVDFIQLMQRTMTSREEENRALELTDISYGLAALGKEIDCAIIALCQVDAQKVENRDNKRPQLGDLRWSQGMREAADFIGLCYRHQTYFPDPMAPDNLEINFGKARDAEPFIAVLNWIGKYMHLDSPLRRARAA